MCSGTSPKGPNQLKQPNNDIGIVIYRIHPDGNQLDAVWYSTLLDQKAMGTGIAIGDTTHGFAGEYAISYLSYDGRDAGTCNLKIVKTDNIYDVFWITNDTVTSRGVGIETADGLAVGWREVT